MAKHGKGSKHVHVRRYRQWQHGALRHAKDHPRGQTPKLSLRRTPLQLVFDFGCHDRHG